MGGSARNYIVAAKSLQYKALSHKLSRDSNCSPNDTLCVCLKSLMSSPSLCSSSRHAASVGRRHEIMSDNSSRLLRDEASPRPRGWLSSEPPADSGVQSSNISSSLSELPLLQLRSKRRRRPSEVVLCHACFTGKSSSERLLRQFRRFPHVVLLCVEDDERGIVSVPHILFLSRVGRLPLDGS
jgi:hypothetical protein